MIPLASLAASIAAAPADPHWTFTQVALIIARVLVAVGVLLGLYRVWRGPGLPDRVVALDLLGTLSVAIAVLTAMASNEPAILIVAMVMALLLFVSTLAASHFLLATRADRDAKARAAGADQPQEDA